MLSFSQDKKWIEAKRVIGNLNWIEIVSYYRFINGNNVFVYSIVDGDKRLIVDVISEDTVLLLSKNGELVTDDYDSVLNSKKIFKYSDKYERRTYSLGSHNFNIATESRL
jgi:hypothetical protein